jgi:hypothetical protein
LDQEELDDGDASRFLLSHETIEGAEVRTVDPETQAKLEALLEAAGENVVVYNIKPVLIIVNLQFLDTAGVPWKSVTLHSSYYISILTCKNLFVVYGFFILEFKCVCPISMRNIGT